MSDRAIERRANHKLAVLRHVEAVSGNVAATCRYHGISRQAYCAWKRRYGAEGFEDSALCITELARVCVHQHVFTGVHLYDHDYCAQDYVTVPRDFWWIRPEALPERARARLTVQSRRWSGCWRRGWRSP
jgi:hypothetical protein